MDGQLYKVSLKEVLNVERMVSCLLSRCVCVCLCVLCVGTPVCVPTCGWNLLKEKKKSKNGEGYWGGGTR